MSKIANEMEQAHDMYLIPQSLIEGAIRNLKRALPKYGGGTTDRDDHDETLQYVKRLQDCLSSPSVQDHHEAALAGPCPICNGIEGCDHTVPERRRAFSDLSANQHTDPMAWEALRRAEARLQEKDGQTLFTLESLKWHIADQRKLISIAREALSHRDAINSAESDVWKGDKRQWIKAILVEMSVALEEATAEAEVQAALDKAINEIVGRKASSKTESPDLVCRTCGGWGECGDYAEPSPCPDCNHHHEAGGAPGQEEIVARACDYWFERARHLADEAGYDYTPPEPGSEYDAHFRESMSGLVSLIASLVPPSDQQGREQVIGELCEALDGILQHTSTTIGGWEVCRLSNFADARAALAKARSAAQ